MIFECLLGFVPTRGVFVLELSVCVCVCVRASCFCCCCLAQLARQRLVLGSRGATSYQRLFLGRCEVVQLGLEVAGVSMASVFMLSIVQPQAPKAEAVSARTMGALDSEPSHHQCYLASTL